MSKGRILIVDNEPQIRRVMRTTLIANGFEVEDVRSGPEALDLLHAATYDLVLLDINMPGMTGFEACRSIRAVSNTPIIMLTVRDAERDKVEALEAGADDFVTKPFSSPELVARIRAVLRRGLVPSEFGRAQVQIGEAKIDFETRVVTGHQGPVHLTPKEFDLLSYLTARANKTIGHRELLRAVWGPDYGDEQEYLRVFINRLRKKIERTPTRPKYLLTDPWVGYRLQVPK